MEVERVRLLRNDALIDVERKRILAELEERERELERERQAKRRGQAAPRHWHFRNNWPWQTKYVPCKANCCPVTAICWTEHDDRKNRWRSEGMA